MSDNSAIEWTDATWNPVTGCTEVSPGCDNCYAKTFAERFRGVAGHHFERGFDVTLRPDKVGLPFSWRAPRKVFVNSMSDLFHQDVSDEYIANVFAVMAGTARHTYQVLTKRHARMRSLLSSSAFRADVVSWLHHWGDEDDVRFHDMAEEIEADRNWPIRNVWLGVSVEAQQWADIRIPALLDTPAAVRFISAEPLLGSVDIWSYLLHQCDCVGEHVRQSEHGPRLNWVIVGGESGHGARPMHPDWARGLRDQCQDTGVPFLFKQWGEWGPAPWSVRIPNAAHLSRDELVAAKTDAEACAATHHIQPSGHLYEPDHKPWSVERDPDGDYPGAVRRWGKKRAGRELDGRTWDEYPAVSR